MSSTSETSHAKNVAAFQQLITFCQGYGAAYNPFRKELMISSLQSTLVQAQTALANVKDTRATFDNATNRRREVFNALKPLAARVVNTLAASGATKLAIADARGIIRKIEGRRAGTAKPVTAPNATAGEAVQNRQISVSQLSFDNQVDHFGSLLSLVGQQQSYTPNEDDITITSLQQSLTAFNAVNNEVTQALVAVTNNRNQRDAVLYDPITGMVQVATAVKLYVKGAFGASSQQYRQLASIKFNSR